MSDSFGQLLKFSKKPSKEIFSYSEKDIGVIRRGRRPKRITASEISMVGLFKAGLR